MGSEVGSVVSVISEIREILNLRMTDEFRIQHLASVIQKSLKTSIKPDVIAKEFSDNKTPFVTAQVSHLYLVYHAFC